MSGYTVTPWRNQADLVRVRQQLYQDEDHDVRRNAVNRVMAWKLRGNLPHAVESTALLVDAMLHHHQNAARPTMNSTFSVRAVYSAAFTRFVTGFCDIGRSKERSLEPSSMLDIARQLDMPAEFVALRHEATHEELPALRRLVHASNDALTWLWNAYWNRIGEGETKTDGQNQEVDSQNVELEARKVLRAFRSARRDAIRAGSYQRPEQEVLIAETARTCLKLGNGKANRIEAVIRVMLEDKLLSPSKRELGSSLQGAYLLWDGLLQRMWGDEPFTLETFVRSLLHEIGNGANIQSENDAQREAYCLWLRHLIDDGTWHSILGGVEVLRLRTEMMQWCCTYPGHWSQTLGSHLIRSGSPEFGDDWQDIFQASLLKSAGGDEFDTNIENRDLDETGLSRNLSNVDTQDDCNISNWARAIMPIRNPIGVVR